MTHSAPTPSLADLRAEIDRIDEAMHRLLMERGEIIDQLVAVKRSQTEGSAFRPAREADMMRRLVERHRGLLPLDTVESIWRVIISTFTFVQAPYRVHADAAMGDAAMRDAARFHFGFTVPYAPLSGADAVIAAVAASRGDLGLVPVEGASAAWWTALEPQEAPKIIARLPFVERADHPAALPVFVVSRPILDAAVEEVRLYSVRLDSGAAALPAGLAGVLLKAAMSDDKADLLISVGPGHALEDVLAVLRQGGAVPGAVTPVGGHAAPHRMAHRAAA